MKYTPVIGLETHVELATASKMFCGCSAEHFQAPPNTHTCPVCLGLPGALPVPNKRAVDWTLLLAEALQCQLNTQSHFDRKNYFYPDLPKSYQITQYEKPLGENGQLEIAPGKIIRIRRVHLEEDTGKLQHTQIGSDRVVLVDFNRSGVPLVEIVTEPDFRSLEEVDLYVKKLQRIIRRLEISNADMEKGSMRLEPSISLSGDEVPVPLPNDQLPPYRVELKNINSFRFARKALEYEIQRQSELLTMGQKVLQQTRGWSEDKNATFAQREKEGEHDYRYFPEPDIPPLEFTPEELEAIKHKIPELPYPRAVRLINQYGLSDYQADLLTENKDLADYFEKAVTTAAKNVSPKEIANWLINKKIDIAKLSPQALLAEIASAKETTTISDEEMERMVREVLAENSQAVADYRKGKTQILGFLIGCMVKKIGPKADRNAISQKLQEKLRVS